MDLLLPPPSALIQDDPAAADPARRKVAPKSRLSRLFAFRSTPNLRRVSSQEEPPVLNLSVDVDSTPITLDCSTLEDVFTDRYEWAVLYENQRGSVLLFSPFSQSHLLLTGSLPSLYPTIRAYHCCHLTPHPLLFQTPLSSAPNNLPFLLTTTLFQMGIGIGYPAAG